MDLDIQFLYKNKSKKNYYHPKQFFMHANIKHIVQKIFNKQSLQQINFHSFCAFIYYCIIYKFITKEIYFLKDSVATRHGFKPHALSSTENAQGERVD
jgi:hypothetical protein